MRIFVVGGYGLVGGYVVSRLIADGHVVVGAGRDVHTARLRYPAIRWVRVDLATATAAAWRQLLDQIDVVVNCAGALQDSPRDSLEQVHVAGIEALAEGARRAGVSRIVHISAAGVANNPSAFAVTKTAGEAALAQSGLDWIVLRPGLVLAGAAYGGSALLRGLAATPFVVVAAQPNCLIQVASAKDVAEAVAHAVRPDAPSQVSVDLVAPEPHRLSEILTALRAWMGFAPAPIVAAPLPLARCVSAFADSLAWLGWRSPMRSAALAQLNVGVLGDPKGAERLGVRMRDLDEIIAEEPSNVQDRWFARLYFLKPVCIALLAIFWIGSGAIGLVQVERAARVLTDGGFDPGWARTTVQLGSVVDIGLGFLACLSSTARMALVGMLVASAAYVVGATIWRPDLWTDPLGPLLKILPGALLALLTLALLDDR